MSPHRWQHPSIEESTNIPEDLAPSSSPWLRYLAMSKNKVIGGEVVDMTGVSTCFSWLSSTLWVSSVLPPDLHLLPGEGGDHGHRLHLLHCQEGQVVEPPGQDGHCVSAVWTPWLPCVLLALGPPRKLLMADWNRGCRGAWQWWWWWWWTGHRRRLAQRWGRSKRDVCWKRCIK